MNLNGQMFINTPGELPEDLDALDDDTLISSAVFAHLAGMKIESLRSMKTRSDKRRATDPRPGDIPAAERQKIGNSPVWRLGVFRRWNANKPGHGAGGGRRPGFRPAPKKVDLPADCPHCGQEITGRDIKAQEEKRAEQELREGPAVPEALPSGVNEDRKARELT